MPKPARNWTHARDKVLREGVCRVPTCEATNLDAAHIIGRTHDYTVPLRVTFDEEVWAPGKVWPYRIIPLCSEHHRLQHAGQLDILPLLTIEEQAQAVADAGGIERAGSRF